MRPRVQRHTGLTPLALIALLCLALAGVAPVWAQQDRGPNNPVFFSPTSPIPTRVLVAATGNVTVAAPGAAIDGVNLNSLDRVLLWLQTNQTENGPYLWNGAAVPMTRAADFNAADEFIPGTAVQVSSGDTYGGASFMLRNTGAITLGTTPITFTRPTALCGGANNPPCGGAQGELADPDTVLQDVIEFGSGAPAAGSCPRERYFYMKTSAPTRLYHCPGGVGANPEIVDANSDAFNTITDGTNSATASGSSTFRFVAGANTTITCSNATSPKQCTWTATGGGGGTQTVTRPMSLMTHSASDANAKVETVDGTNFDYTGLLFDDGATGCGYYKFQIPPNLGTTPAWSLIATHKAVSGAGGNVVLTVSAKDFATNVALDSALTALHTNATFAVNTSANTTMTTLSSGGYDATEAIAAGNFLVVSLCRAGGNASDTLSAPWLLLHLSIRFTENS